MMKIDETVAKLMDAKTLEDREAALLFMGIAAGTILRLREGLKEANARLTAVAKEIDRVLN